MKISEQDLIALKDLRWQVEMAKSAAEIADLKAQLSQEKLQNLISLLYRRYNINDTSSIDLSTGNIFSTVTSTIKDPVLITENKDEINVKKDK